MSSPAVHAAHFSSELLESDPVESFESQASTSNRVPFTATHLYFNQVERMRHRRLTLDEVELADSNCFYVSSFSQGETTNLPQFSRSRFTATDSFTDLPVPAFESHADAFERQADAFESHVDSFERSSEPLFGDNNWVVFQPESRRHYMFEPQALRNHPAVLSLKAEATVERTRSNAQFRQQSTAARLQEACAVPAVDTKTLQTLIEHRRRRQAERLDLITRTRHRELFPSRTPLQQLAHLLKVIKEHAWMHESRLRVYFNDFRTLAGFNSR